MAENWDLSAVVNNTCTPTTNFTNTFSENINSENPLEFLNHLTFGDDDGLHSFSELEPPKINCFQDVQDSFCNPFSFPTSGDHDALQGGGDNILKPTPPISIHDFQVVPPQDHSPFLSQHYQQQQQQEQQNNYHMIHPNYSTMSSPDRFICDNFQEQFGQGQCSFLRPRLLFQHQAAPPIPIPRLPTQPTACPRSRNKKCNQKRKLEKVPADKLNSDVWSWRKYGQKPIKGSPYPRNYYRCSSSKGCTARKQVEKSNTDPDMFIVCYTGDHNHTRPTINWNSHGSRYRFLGRTNINIPSNKEYGTSSTAPPTTEKGSSFLSPVLSATRMSQTTPLLVSKDHVDNGGDIEGHVGTRNDVGKGDGNNILIPKLDEVKI